jgi:hypothetical protein
MRFASWKVSTAAALLLGAASFAAQADELAMPSGSPADHPSRGMSMEKVEATFGAPSSRVPAVGQPPITRWEYPGFVVYFEDSTVLHTVIKS